MFLRFVVSRVHKDSQVDDGIFGTAHALQDAAGTVERDRLTEVLAWFEQHLPTPGRFNRSTSKGYYRRATKGISWLRDTAEMHLSLMYELARIVEANGHPVSVIRQDRIGYTIYEDEFQVVAEPFADTRTSA